MQIKNYLIAGMFAATLFSCAPATKYEADGAFSSETGFSQVVPPANAATTKPVTPNPTITPTKPTTPEIMVTQPTTPATPTSSSTPTTPTSSSTPATPTLTEISSSPEIIIGSPVSTDVGVGVNVLPESYTTSAPTEPYIDEGAKQLIDNQIGGDIFNTKIFGVAGFEWVGWSRKNVSLKFNFATERQITKVKIGFNFNNGGGVLLPKNVVINDKAYALKGNELKRNSRGFLVFNLNLKTNQINIDLERNPTRQWILIDEVKFVAVAQ